MALNRRSANRFSANIWPGFVDAMTALLLVLMFVLTIFMVVQFVLRDTISGQDEELDSLTNELSGLAQALGLEQSRSADLQGNVSALTATLNTARTEAEAQGALIASLSTQTSDQAAQIAGFEEQVASLLAQNTDLSGSLAQSQSRVAVLTGEATSAADREAALADQNRVLLADKDALAAANLEVISQKDALQLALAQARDEIDESTQAARLAAAQAEALDALIADLQANVSAKDGSLSDTLALLAQSQADLEGARGSLTAALSQMGTSGSELSEAQKSLEQTQAELAQSQQALTQKGLTEQELRTRLDELVAGLSDAEKAKLAQAAAAAALREKLKGAEDELTAMTLALEAERKGAEDTLTLLAAAKTQVSEADLKAAETLSEAEKQAALLAVARQELLNEQDISLEAQRKMALLNQQTVELRKQLDTLQGLLDFASAADTKSKVQIEALGANLNTALARVAAEQKKLASETQKTAVLEAAERVRLEAEAKDLKKFRSEFFGRLRDVLGSREGVRIVGDRFVFSSEILFGAGSADLGPRGQEEIAKVANIILDVADQIPSEIDWILRVDGHTDRVPLSGNGAYADNWELSQARALSVVKYLISDLGVPAGRLAANGFGEFQPIVDGTSVEALALNRRIELKFTEK
jgi:chemotaxis protein MotB